jgi:chromate transport protein ChrA
MILGRAHREERRFRPEEMHRMVQNELGLWIGILVVIAILVIAGVWAIASAQKKKINETLTVVLMILAVTAVGIVLSELILLAT